MGTKMFLVCDICQKSMEIEQFDEIPTGWAKYRLYKERPTKDLEPNYRPISVCETCIPREDQSFRFKFWKKLFPDKE